MKITGIEICSMHIPLKTPFKTALRSVSSIDDIVVRVLTDSGEVGYGEAPPTAVITGDTLPSIAGAIREILGPTLLGRDVEDIEGNCKALRGAMVGNHSPKAALEIALYDLWGKAMGQPLYKLLGGAKSELETDITISVNAPEEMAADAQRAVADGFRCLKVKVGTNPTLDLERLRAVRAAVPAETVLRVDANQGWTAKEAVRCIQAIERADIRPELVEQPVRAHDLEGLRYVSSRVDTPILADEAVFDERDALRVLETHAADLLNLKLMKTGGLSTALRILALAEAYGVRCMMGCMLEGNVSVTAAAHLAMAKENITLIDLDGPALCLTNPVQGGACFEQSRITLPNAPGLGIAHIDGLVL